MSHTLLLEELNELSKESIFNIEEIRSLYSRFRYLDRSNSGLLTASDLFLIPEFKCNPLSSCVIEVLEDLNDYDLFNFNSFLGFMEIFHKNTNIKKRHKFFFKLLNRNGDGRICKKVLKYFYLKMHGDNFNDENCIKAINNIIEKYGCKEKGVLKYEGVIKFYLDFNLERFFVFNF